MKNVQKPLLQWAHSFLWFITEQFNGSFTMNLQMKVQSLLYIIQYVLMS